MSFLCDLNRPLQAIQPGFPPDPAPSPDPEFPPVPGPDEIPPEPIDNPRPLPDFEDTPPVRPIDQEFSRVSKFG